MIDVADAADPESFADPIARTILAEARLRAEVERFADLERRLVIVTRPSATTACCAGRPVERHRKKKKASASLRLCVETLRSPPPPRSKSR